MEVLFAHEVGERLPHDGGRQWGGGALQTRDTGGPSRFCPVRSAPILFTSPELRCYFDPRLPGQRVTLPGGGGGGGEREFRFRSRPLPPGAIAAAWSSGCLRVPFPGAAAAKNHQPRGEASWEAAQGRAAAGLAWPMHALDS